MARIDLEPSLILNTRESSIHRVNNANTGLQTACNSSPMPIIVRSGELGNVKLVVRKVMREGLFTVIIVG